MPLAALWLGRREQKLERGALGRTLEVEPYAVMHTGMIVSMLARRVSVPRPKNLGSGSHCTGGRRPCSSRMAHRATSDDTHSTEQNTLRAEMGATPPRVRGPAGRKVSRQRGGWAE